jgi:uncharacterized membrane protein
MTTDEKIQLIGQKIYMLSGSLDKYRAELDSLKQQLEALRTEKAASEGKTIVTPLAPPIEKPIAPPAAEPVKEQPVITESANVFKEEPLVSHIVPSPPPPPKVKPAFNLEEYIGGNLIAKIGITIFVIGIAMGVKYAIDKDLITPLTRIVLGYVTGGILLAIALKLKKNYTAFSAVLLSGGMATLYFTTFAAWNFYDIIPLEAAFGLMVVFTAFTVFAATIYDQQWIGIFGLVGAYAVPILLDENSGRAHILFIYMTIINAGVLILSFKKYWRILTWVAYSLSWMIFAGWFLSRYTPDRYITTALVFSFVFFLSFYLSFIAYKTIRKEQFNFGDIILVLLNSFIYFSIGYAVMSDIPYGSGEEGKYLGLFTLGNALIHLAFAYSVFVNKQVDRKLFYLIMALVLTFVTIAVPIQLEGHWVTLFWVAEMFILFWIGRIKNVRFYEWMSFAMLLLAVVSLMHDWRIYLDDIYDDSIRTWVPLGNITFLTSAMAILSLAGMIFVHFKYPLAPEERKRYGFYDAVDYFLPITLIIVTYFAFSNEIGQYFDARVANTAVQLGNESMMGFPAYNYDLFEFKRLWLINYTMLFVFALGVAARRLWRAPGMGWAVFVMEAITAFVFLTIGLFTLAELRENYINGYNAEYFSISSMHLNIRYICFVFLGMLVYNMYSRTQWQQEHKAVKGFLYPLINIIIVTVLSSELTHLMMITHTDEAERYENISHKMGYTVLWGLYSFVLIAVGIMRKNKLLRISAIALFAISLIKLCTYDILSLSMGYKVAAFIALGVILLVVAFMYQKFKTLIFGDDEK